MLYLVKAICITEARFGPNVVEVQDDAIGFSTVLTRRQIEDRQDMWDIALDGRVHLREPHLVEAVAVKCTALCCSKAVRVGADHFALRHLPQ
jgi:hypothetical protein